MTGTISTAVEAVASLMNEARHIGSLARASAAANAAALEAAAEARENARGFEAPQLAALKRLAGLVQSRIYGNANPIDSAEPAEVIRDMVKAFLEGATGRTEASARGGAANNYYKIARLGAWGSAILHSLHQRREYWRRNLEAAKAAGDHEGVAHARRFAEYCGLAPQVEGGSVSWIEEGKAKTARHYGRPSKTIARGGLDINIGYGRATNALSIAASYADLVYTYGERAICDEVADALLDNGGRVDVSSIVSNVAAKAAAAVRELLDSPQAVDSTESAAIATLLAIIEDIAKRGFTRAENAASGHIEPEYVAGAELEPEPEPEPEPAKAKGKGKRSSL